MSWLWDFSTSHSWDSETFSLLHKVSKSNIEFQQSQNEGHFLNTLSKFVSYFLTLVVSHKAYTSLQKWCGI